MKYSGEIKGQTQKKDFVQIFCVLAFFIVFVFLFESYVDRILII